MSDAPHFKYDHETRQFERRVLFLVALVQFINIWDFMIVMPLGPDFSRALGIDISHLGWIAGSYSLSASIVGVLAARFIDRFDRRSVLLFSLCGLVLSTLSMILANTLTHLIALRMLTGAFGGPVIASSMAIIADIFPDSRRGEAVGKVFGSFSMAAILGVPLSLLIAQYLGWWAPFVAVSFIAAITLVITRLYLPPMRYHLTPESSIGWHPDISPFSVIGSLRSNASMRTACIVMASATFATFLLIPNISAHVQQNMGYPRQWLGFLYFCGGISAFFTMRVIGKRSDKIGYAKTCAFATILVSLCTWLWFYIQTTAIPIPVYFIFFMMGMSTRNVTSNALLTKIPAPHERAGFMSMMSAIQHLMAGVGAMCSTFMLHETPQGHLDGLGKLSIISIITFMVMPSLMFRIERLLRAAGIVKKPV